MDTCGFDHVGCLGCHRRFASCSPSSSTPEGEGSRETVDSQKIGAKPLRVREWHGYHFFKKRKDLQKVDQKSSLCFFLQIDTTISYKWHLGMYILQDVTSFEQTCFVPAEPCCLEAPKKRLGSCH